MFPAVRRCVTELPHRAADCIPDLGDALGLSARPLPRAKLRARVGLTSSRAEFLSVGGLVARDMDAAIVKANGLAADESWLDFGCGSGRIARHFDQRGRPSVLAGLDVDADAVSWCARFLKGSFKPVNARPPAPFADGSFDVAYSVSVFSHLDEEPQLAWLAEIHRLLRARGLLVVSTHSPSLTWTRPDLTAEQSRRLDETGFLFAPGQGRFNDDSAFHSEAYLRGAWTRHFELVAFSAGGLAGYQDLSTWRKR